MTPRAPRKPPNPSRVFLARFLGRPWRELEREYRKLKRHREEREATDAEVTRADGSKEPLE
jgi:hypothetical protein